MRREADIHDFAKGKLKRIRARLKTDSGRVPIQLSVSEAGIRAFGVPKATRPDIHKRVMGDFEGATIGRGWENFRFNIEFPSYSRKRAAASWLRSAYLAFFSTLGYRFIWRQELNVVRDRIRDPEQELPVAFRIIRPEHSEPMLARVEAPEVFRSYVMFYRPNVVFLPDYNDHTLYERLAQHPDTNVNFTGKQYPWPTGGPTFFHDNG
jgi:hypothetical protein